jgi:hypothetical protein
MISPETPVDILAEIPRAIAELTKEMREVRLTLNMMYELFEEAIDTGAGDYPGHIRIHQE